MFEKNKELTTTFKIPATAKLYCEYSNLKELTAIIRSEEFQENEYLHIGECSNIVFTEYFDGIVLHSAIKGIKRYDKDEKSVFAIVGAGEKWTDFVDWCISENLGGTENLAGIPGEVGSAAVQNIGAYGVEAKDIIHNVECYDTLENKIITLSKDECQYGYRDSIFKNQNKGRYIITRVSFRLKNSTEAENLEYGSLKELKESGIRPTIREVADKIIEIRNSKLPDPHLLGNAGSFFKNPIIHWYYFQEAVKPFAPGIPSYPTDNQYYVKVSAAWLIEHAGLSGFSIGGAQVYPGHALILVNKGNATAKDVVELSNHIIETVRKKFGIVLQPEVNLINSEIKVTILGSGTSKGIPEIGCFCHTCSSKDSKDKRLRASALVETEGIKILIDVSPDFRQQALDNNIYHADALLITHSHYDHVGGIDDLRPFCATTKFPVYLKEDVNKDLHRRVDYCFKDELYPGVPSFEMNEVDDQTFYIKGIKIIPITVYHGKLPILGYRIGSFAYITDAKTIDDEQLEKLKGVKVMVLNALREREHFAHFSLAEALEIINKIKPEKAYLTHFCHEIGRHEELSAKLPENVFASYDGLKFTVK